MLASQSEDEPQDKQACPRLCLDHVDHPGLAEFKSRSAERRASWHAARAEMVAISPQSIKVNLLKNSRLDADVVCPSTR
jgi:hypothetical protein